jgi:hypothetical protein
MLKQKLEKAGFFCVEGNTFSTEKYRQQQLRKLENKGLSMTEDDVKRHRELYFAPEAITFYQPEAFYPQACTGDMCKVEGDGVLLPCPNCESNKEVTPLSTNPQQYRIVHGMGTW